MITTKDIHQLALMAGRINPDEVEGLKYSVDPISYGWLRGGDYCYQVYIPTRTKLYSVTFKLPVEVAEMHQVNPDDLESWVDVYRFGKIEDISLDPLGCVVRMSNGKRVELQNSSLEGQQDFDFSARGLIALWDEALG